MYTGVLGLRLRPMSTTSSSLSYPMAGGLFLSLGPKRLNPQFFLSANSGPHDQQSCGCEPAVLPFSLTPPPTTNKAADVNPQFFLSAYRLLRKLLICAVVACPTVLT
jgi:hypothetical protein